MADTRDGQKVMIAVDGGVESSRAFHFYVNHVHKAGNSVVLVEALAAVYIPQATQCDLDRMRHLAREDSQDVLEKFTDELSQLNIPYTVESGFAESAGKYICELAGQHKADLVVLGTRGLRRMQRLLKGSVSDYVLHHTKCPVLICAGLHEEDDLVEIDALHIDGDGDVKEGEQN